MPHRVRMGDTLIATLSLDMSEQEVEYLRAKEAKLKIFTTSSNPYYMLTTKEIIFSKPSATIEFRKIREHGNAQVRFADLSNILVGQIDKKYEKKIRQKLSENILAATKKHDDEFVYLNKRDVNYIKLRMPKNTRYRSGDIIKIEPVIKDVIISDKIIMLKEENPRHPILSCQVRVEYDGVKNIRLENGEVFGFVK